MELIESRPLMDRDELLRYVSERDGFILVTPKNARPILFSKGRLMGDPQALPAKLEGVSIYSLDRWEVLDFLNGELKLPAQKSPEVEKEEPKPETPKSISLELSLEVPPEFELSVENGIIGALRHLFQRNRIVVSRIEASGRVKQGFTGTNLLILRVSVEGYSTGEADKELVAGTIKEYVERELGFKTTVAIREFKLERVERLPVLRLQRRALQFRGGRVLEVPLSTSRTVKVDKNRLEKEVERILQEAGITEEFLSFKEGEKSRDTGIFEDWIREELAKLKGITLNWVRVGGNEHGYSLAVGINRVSRALSDVKIVEAVKEAVRRAEAEASAAGIGGHFRSAYVVIEKDIY
ncbi:hypothetical protein [Thermococcus stetteri]|uniref:hypothetical protein n=1 Tax=Thermococcus stetteri TaxID=49900 RepID=UPI001AE76C77|nr:hypothetical protein [Thermococcus stetteri]